MSGIPFAIHRAVSGKPAKDEMDDAMRLTFNGWENRNVAKRSTLLNYVLGRGNCFTFVTLKPDTGFWRHATQVEEIGGIGLDFDDGMLWTEAQADPILSTAWVCYPSPSFTPERQWKFRLLWRFDSPVTDTSVVRLLLARLMDLYPVDKKCAEPHRLWFGNPGADPLYLSHDDAGIVPVQQIEEAWELWAVVNPKGGHVRALEKKASREVGADSAFNYCPIVDGFYRDDVEVTRQLMGVIAPWAGRNSGTYQAADALMVGAASWLGEEIFLRLCNEHNWIYAEGKGSMEEVVRDRLRSLDGSPKKLWHWSLGELVDLGAITEDKRSDLMRFTWSRRYG
jgi:hypothetical protein